MHNTPNKHKRSKEVVECTRVHYRGKLRQKTRRRNERNWSSVEALVLETRQKR